MNFFEQQSKAQSKSKTLVFLFILAVIALIIVAYFPIQYVVYDLIYDQKLHRNFVKDNPIIWNYDLFFKVALGTIVLVGGASLYKIRQLSQGGSVIAELMNGRLLDSNTKDFKEKQLLNVVEEMAIAAGIPAPNVYLLDHEQTINAFAAGYTTGDAVIGVTRGTIEKLKRDELQGVIAHEFSHILHGDMRLNIKLMGLLHGILVIALIGRSIMSSKSRRSSRKGGGHAIVVGLSFFIIGWVGYFFAKLIQAAVSRQREFLADASAVQYTRNPEGIGNALKKIAGYLGAPAVGSYLLAGNGAQISHMTFGTVNSMQIFTWTSTHPLITDRIKAIDPRFDTNQKMMPGSLETKHQKLSTEPVEKMESSAVISNMVGTIPAAAVAMQRTWLEGLDANLYKAAHHPQQSKAVMYVLLADYDEKSKTAFEKFLRVSDPHIIDVFQALWMPIKSLGTEVRMQLVDLSIPALRNLPKEEFLLFVQTMSGLIKLDGTMSLTEFLLMKMVKKYLQQHFYPPKTSPISIYDSTQVEKEITLILSALAKAENTDATQAAQAFRAGGSYVGLQSSMITSQIPIEAIHASLKKLRETSFEIREKIINACAKTVLSDQKVSWQEKEILRIIGDSLECPIPNLSN